MRTITGFAGGHTVGEKLTSGRVFPLTLTPPSTNSPRACPDLVDLVEREREGLAEALRLHGAILIRGFGVETAQDFSDVVEALGWEEFEYVGGGNRVRVVGRALRTMNEPPPEQLLNFHHETAMIKEPAAKIIFYCMQRAPEGGQTSVIQSEVVVEKMEERLPHVTEKLQRDGMLTVFHTTDWKRMLKVDDPTEAQKSHKSTLQESLRFCKALELLECNSVKFNEDGSADIIRGPMNPVKEINGRRVWFNSVLGYSTANRQVWVGYGDGSPLPPETEEVYQKILEENCVDVNWEKGDVLVVDNMTVQHARRPAKPPRVMLLSLTN